MSRGEHGPAVALVVVLCGIVARPAAAQPHRTADAWLQSRLQQLAADRRLGGAKVNYVVNDLRSGRTLAQREADLAVPVASSVKLVTAATALAHLGPAYRFRTALYVDQHEHGVVKGDLYLKGFGDPTLSEGDLWDLACSLFDTGIREVRGAIVIDDGFFDGQTLPPLYETRSTDMYYRPLVAPLSIHENTVSVRVLGGRSPGDPTRVLLRPHSSYLKLRDRTVTVGPRRRSHLDIRTRAVKNATLVDLSGRVRVGHRGRWERRRIEHPALLAGHTLADLLRRRGIRFRSGRVGQGTAPAGRRPVAVHRSAPLGTIVRYMTKTSSNFVAEMLIKVLGAELEGPPGTWGKGLQVAARHLARLKIKPGSYAMKNASGLYEDNRFSPRQLATVIREAARSFRYGPDFVSALAIAGVDGTLAHRFVGSGAEGYVRAKTGTLAAVVSLSGLAGAAASREPLVFSIAVTELPPGHILAARKVVDAMAGALVTYLERSQ